MGASVGASMGSGVGPCVGAVVGSLLCDCVTIQKEIGIDVGASVGASLGSGVGPVGVYSAAERQHVGGNRQSRIRDDI